MSEKEAKSPPSMSDESTVIQEDAVGEFADQARAAGLTLPKRRPTRLGEVAVIIVVIILVAVGVGVATGWMNLRPASDGPPGLFGTQACSAQVTQKVTLEGTSSSDAEPLLTSSWQTLADRFTGAYGSCVSITYPSAATGSGLSALSSRAADFAVLATAPTLAEIDALPDPVYVLPATLGSVSIIYDLPGFEGTLQLNGSVLAEIYEGTLTTWDSPAIAALNPGATLPSDLQISVLYRSDPSSVNAAFTGYLADSSAAWNSSLGAGDQVAWPTGVGVSSSVSMVGQIAGTPGSIGYVPTGSTLNAGIGTAALQNPGGQFVAPSPSTVSGAATALQNATHAAGANWTGVSLVNAPGVSSYPLADLAYLVVFQDLGKAYGGNLSLNSAAWELTFLWWAVTDGGYVTGNAGLLELPSGMVTPCQIVLELVAFDGKSVLESSEGSETGGETGEF